MRVLVACEFSGIVRDAFVARGHDAVSCDPLDSERQGRHYRTRLEHVMSEPTSANGWDLLIAHPPCTYLAVSGARWFKGREREQADALAFVRYIMDLPIARVAIENPISVISSDG